MATSGVQSAQSDPLLMNYRWQSPGSLFEHQPSVRLDYNISDKHRLSFSGAVIDTYRDPDYLNNPTSGSPAAPNFERYDSLRPLYSGTLRSTLSSNMVNELRGGTTRGRRVVFRRPGQSRASTPSTARVAMRSTSTRTSASRTGTRATP